jgi:hypothetical protein
MGVLCLQRRVRLATPPSRGRSLGDALRFVFGRVCGLRHWRRFDSFPCDLYELASAGKVLRMFCWFRWSTQHSSRSRKVSVMPWTSLRWLRIVFGTVIGNLHDGNDRLDPADGLLASTTIDHALDLLVVCISVGGPLGPCLTLQLTANMRLECGIALIRAFKLTVVVRLSDCNLWCRCREQP